MTSQPTLANLMAKLEVLTHDMAQTQADPQETKEQVKEISCRVLQCWREFILIAKQPT